MYEVAWMEFSKAGAVVRRRKEFKTKAAMERFIEKLFEKDSFYKLLGYTA